MRAVKTKPSSTPCEVSSCGSTPSDRAHIKTRGSGAGWKDHEYIHLCRKHHIESGQIGWFSFVRKYPLIGTVLERKGWFFENVFGVWKLLYRP